MMIVEYMMRNPKLYLDSLSDEDVYQYMKCYPTTGLFNLCKTIQTMLFNAEESINGTFRESQKRKAEDNFEFERDSRRPRRYYENDVREIDTRQVIETSRSNKMEPQPEYIPLQKEKNKDFIAYIDVGNNKPIIPITRAPVPIVPAKVEEISPVPKREEEKKEEEDFSKIALNSLLDVIQGQLLALKDPKNKARVAHYNDIFAQIKDKKLKQDFAKKLINDLF
jgi:hypothetical protein